MLVLIIKRLNTTTADVGDALQTMEKHKNQLDALRAPLEQGAEQARSGNFVEDFSMDMLIQDLDKEV